MKHAQPVIIIKKRRHAKHPHHGGAWKVAYADFVTAMMAFFLVMWLVNTSPQVKANLASYFRDPGIFERTSGGGAMPGASLGALAGNAQQPPVAAARAALDEAADHIREALESLPSFQMIKERVDIQLTAEGLRIELLDVADQSFFEIGSTELRPEAIEIIRVITTNVRSLPNKINIEGHTDGRPYPQGLDYSNWELSSGRANSARRVMETFGLLESHLDALHGYGSSKLRNPADPLDARNRRIAVVLRHLQEAPSR
jgi:chemotaxis protein MotB